MAPMIFPSRLIGTPPAKIMTLPSFEAWMPKNWSPDWEFSPRDLVSRSKAREVQAFLTEMSMEPIQALDIRSKARRCPAEQTTAMHMGWPIASALVVATAMMERASARVTEVVVGVVVMLRLYADRS